MIVRMCSPEEASQVVAYHIRNKEHLRPFYPLYEENYFKESYWQEKLALFKDEFKRDQSLKLFVFLKKEPEKVRGTISFNSILRRAAHYCTLGYGIDEEIMNQGLMTEALEASIKYVFEEMNLHRIMANYIPTNESSARVLRKLGFVVEGYARDYLFLNGEWKDHILTSIVNPQWKNKQ